MIIDRLMAERGYAVNAVLVVAHPDDESLWFGGLVTHVPFEWTIVCCSIPESDPERAWKFFDACRAMTAESLLVPLQESPATQPMRLKAIMPMIKPVLDAADIIVTHGHAGESGHRHHKELAAAVSAGYGKKTVHGCYGNGAGSMKVDLTAGGWERKERAIMAYDHIAPLDNGLTKGEALIRKYGSDFNLKVETYNGPS